MLDHARCAPMRAVRNDSRLDIAGTGAASAATSSARAARVVLDDLALRGPERATGFDGCGRVTELGFAPSTAVAVRSGNVRSCTKSDSRRNLRRRSHGPWAWQRGSLDESTAHWTDRPGCRSSPERGLTRDPGFCGRAGPQNGRRRPNSSAKRTRQPWSAAAWSMPSGAVAPASSWARRHIMLRSVLGGAGPTSIDRGGRSIVTAARIIEASPALRYATRDRSRTTQRALAELVAAEAGAPSRRLSSLESLRPPSWARSGRWSSMFAGASWRIARSGAGRERALQGKRAVRAPRSAVSRTTLSRTLNGYVGRHHLLVLEEEMMAPTTWRQLHQISRRRRLKARQLSTTGSATRGPWSSRTRGTSRPSAPRARLPWRRSSPEFDRRNVKVIGLSVDPVDNHFQMGGRHRGNARVRRPTTRSSATPTSTSRSSTGCCRPPSRAIALRATPADNQTVRNVFRRRPGQEDQSDPRLSDDDRPEFRRGPARDRLAAADREAQGRDAGQLAAGRQGDHRRVGLR